MKNGEPAEHKLVLPKDNEVIGRVTKATGAANFMVLCSDNYERLCTIPGRLKRVFWVKEGDIVLVKPWVVQTNERGDIIWRYSIMDRDELKKRGYNIP